MSWADLEWPDLLPDFPPPQPSPAPPRPDVPADIAEQVRRAERRRGVFVPLCVLVGATLFCAGVGVYRVTFSDGHAAGETGLAPTPAALLLMLAGLLLATLLPALVVLLVIGPSWRQRQQHLAVLQWERARREWQTVGDAVGSILLSGIVIGLACRVPRPHQPLCKQEHDARPAHPGNRRSQHQ